MYVRVTGHFARKIKRGIAGSSNYSAFLFTVALMGIQRYAYSIELLIAHRFINGSGIKIIKLSDRIPRQQA